MAAPTAKLSTAASKHPVGFCDRSVGLSGCTWIRPVGLSGLLQLVSTIIFQLDRSQNPTLPRQGKKRTVPAIDGVHTAAVRDGRIGKGPRMADAAQGARQLVLLHGRDDARKVFDGDRSLIDIASQVLSDDSGHRGYSYSGLCLTSLPHRRLGDDEAWERTAGPLTLLIEPGRLKTGPGPTQFVGVPYGARGRLILIYLQTQAVISGSREVSLGRSMREWLGRMGVSVGGETAKAFREQARRIATCTMRFHWQTTSTRCSPSGPEGGAGTVIGSSTGTAFTNQQIVKSGLFFHNNQSDDRQGNLWEDRVVLDADFFDTLRKHPVPLRDAAVRELKENSAALDIYVWLAFRLHHLERPVTITWHDLHQQFGSEYKQLKHFKPRFLTSLARAVAAYPEARVEVEERHILLSPSPSPVPRTGPRTKQAQNILAAGGR